MYTIIYSVMPSPHLRLLSEEFGAENITVVHEWTEQEHVSYNIIVDPSAPVISISRSSARITLTYNIAYRVIFTATHMCGQVSTNVSNLHYGEKQSL